MAIILRKTQDDFGPCCYIPLTKKMVAIVDPDDWIWLRNFYWRAVKSKSGFYAVRRVIRDGKATHIRMHREIMKCPADKIVHHDNLNRLDNRKHNLQNVTEEQHHQLSTAI